jgi:mannose-6-phosphate isomerase-like protein (cupin superfamily)
MAGYGFRQAPLLATPRYVVTWGRSYKWPKAKKSHSHHIIVFVKTEQVSYIVDGALRFLIDNREITVSAGEVLCIPPHMPHEAIALEDTVAVDIFNPPRQDWIDKDDAYLRQETGVKA